LSAKQVQADKIALFLQAICASHARPECKNQIKVVQIDKDFSVDSGCL
jgi:hypothetical protein